MGFGLVQGPLNFRCNPGMPCRWAALAEAQAAQSPSVAASCIAQKRYDPFEDCLTFARRPKPSNECDIPVSRSQIPRAAFSASLEITELRHCVSSTEIDCSLRQCLQSMFKNQGAPSRARNALPVPVPIRR
jgi:hypothetical protein